ncbi:MAG: BON domain-containing protein [Gemmatimonadota bacterium]
MPDDYEGTINVDQMDDDDIRALVRQVLDDAERFDPAGIDVSVREGHVAVEGRVGTEAERQRVEKALTGLGIHRYDNHVVVDENARALRADAADDARAEDAAAQAALGESGKTTTDTADHLRPDVAGDLHGTQDMKKAIEEGQSYTPPDDPMQEGIRGGEQH